MLKIHNILYVYFFTVTDIYIYKGVLYICFGAYTQFKVKAHAASIAWLGEE